MLCLCLRVRYILVIAFSFFILIMNMQNGLHLVIYEVAKPYIIKNYCENIDKPALKCDGKCHLRKVLIEEESNDGTQSPANIPPPQIKFETITYFVSTIEKLDFNLDDVNEFTFHSNVLVHSRDKTSKVFRPPIAA